MNSFNGFVVPRKDAPLPAGTRVFSGFDFFASQENGTLPPFAYEVKPVIADDHFLLNLGGSVPADWSLNQIAHYVNYMGPDDSVFEEKAKQLLRAKGFNI